MEHQERCPKCDGKGTIPIPLTPKADYTQCLNCGGKGYLYVKDGRGTGSGSASKGNHGCGCAMLLGIALGIWLIYSSTQEPTQPEGTLTILRCGDYYCYQDLKFPDTFKNAGHRFSKTFHDSDHLWTFSTTPPDANAEFLDETITYYCRRGGFVMRVASEGRKAIPRSQLIPVSEGFESARFNDEKIMAEPLHYVPPKQAGSEERKLLEKRWKKK